MNKPITDDPLHKSKGGLFPASYPSNKSAPNRVRIWLPRFGADLMLAVLHNGHPSASRSLRTRDSKEAESAAWNLIQELGKEVEQNAPGPLRIGRMIDLYLGSAAHASLSPERRKAKERMLARWKSFLGPAKLVNSITREDLTRYVSKRRKEVRQQTVYNDWSALRAVVNWAIGEKWLPVNPLVGLSVATEKNPIQYLITHDEYLALRNGSRGKVPLLVRVYLSTVEGTGRRQMAIARLRWSDVDLLAECITWGEETDKEGVRWKDVPISRRVARILRSWRKHSTGEFVFGSAKAEAYGKSQVDQWMRDLYKAANLDKPYRSGWHSFRRKLATEFKHAPMKDVMELGGWKSEAAFMRYQQADKSTQRDLVNGRRRRSEVVPA